MSTGNDSDIIWESLSHNSKFFDKIVISDRDSKDDTINIIKNMNLGDVDIYNHGEYHWAEQPNVHSEIMKNNDTFDIVFILDADEFILCENFDELSQVPSDCSAFVEWKLFIPIEEVHEDYLRNFKYRRKEEVHPVTRGKIVHLKHNPGILTAGNHNILDKNGNIIQRHIMETIRIAHFPVRNIKQYNKKSDYYNIMFTDLKDISFYGKTKRLDNLEELIDVALNYSNEGQSLTKDDMIYDPI